MLYKKAVTGAAVFKVPGADSGEKANVLAEKIKEAVGDTAVKVSRPEKHASLRVSGLDESVTAEEVVEAMARCGAARQRH